MLQVLPATVSWSLTRILKFLFPMISQFHKNISHLLGNLNTTQQRLLALTLGSMLAKELHSLAGSDRVQHFISLC